MKIFWSRIWCKRDFLVACDRLNRALDCKQVIYNTLTDQLETSNWANPCSNVFWGGMFLFPRALDFDFCYDLDICSQGQAVRAFTVGIFPYVVKRTLGGF